MGRNAQLSQIYRLGRVLRGIETAFIYNDYQPVSTTQIMDFAFALGFYQGRKSNRDRENYSRSIRRACARVCVKVGKAKSRGAPWLWRLREPDVTLREQVWRLGAGSRVSHNAYEKTPRKCVAEKPTKRAILDA
jgi:hypothetical protein